jgi:tRNA-specific adenosine deaminase 2
MVNEQLDRRRWMEEALKEARAALARREVPVGCVVVLRGSVVVGRGGNEVNELGNATRHAELVALDKMHAAIELARAARARGLPAPTTSAGDASLAAFETLEDAVAQCELFVTCEPCIMCAAALQAVGIARVHYGCANDKFGGCGSVVQAAPGLPVEAGTLADEAVALFKQFYDRENPQSKAVIIAALEKAAV